MSGPLINDSTTIKKTSDDSEKHDPLKLTKRYSKKKVNLIQWMYIGLITLWIIIAWALQLYTTNLWGYFILAIPVIFYLIGYFNADQLTIEVEEKTFSMNYISIALFVVIPLTVWIEKNFHGDKWKLSKILVTAVVLALISLIDIWVRPKWISLVRHIKSGLQTMALTLLVFTLYSYYVGQKEFFGHQTSTE